MKITVFYREDGRPAQADVECDHVEVNPARQLYATDAEGVVAAFAVGIWSRYRHGDGTEVLAETGGPAT